MIIDFLRLKTLNVKKKEIEVLQLSDMNRMPSLDGLRAVSIILVLIAHIFYDKQVERYFNFGKVGVEIFFVISGFLITTLLLREKQKTGKLNLKFFYLRRAFRILPLVFLFAGCLFFLDQLFNLQITGLSFFTMIFFLKNLPFDGDWYTGHFWSLSVEEQYYLLFPFILSRLTVRKYSLLLISLIVFIPLLTYLGYNKVGIVETNALVHKASFVIINLFGRGTVGILVGSLISILVFTNKLKVDRIYNARYAGLLVFTLALLTQMHFVLDVFSEYFLIVVFDLLIAITIILNLNSRSWFAGVLNIPSIARVGVLSYSIYVWQQLFTYMQPWRNIGNLGSNLFLNIAVLFIVSYLSYEFFEKKFLAMKKKWSV